MTGFAQIGIAFAALGVMLAFMGLFPGVTGLSPAAGMGLVQFMALFLGMGLLHFGAFAYLKFSFFITRVPTLVQQVGFRLMLTGLLFMGIFGLADFVGFGSQPPSAGAIYFGPLQAIGIVASLLMASIGIGVYAAGGLIAAAPASAREPAAASDASSSSSPTAAASG
jgi:hypothetical protein